VHAVGDLGVRGLAPELLQERVRSLADTMQRARAIERNANDARLLRERLQDRLTNPPHRVRDELDALRLVELMRRANETEVAFVDQIRERDALVLILLRDGYHEAKVGSNELVERFLIIRADTLREPDLFVATDQWVGTDVAQILVERPFFVG